MESGKMKRVFISSPYSGDVERNLALARKFLKIAIEKGYSPVAPHLLYPQVMGNDDPEDYNLGMRLGLQWLAVCDEIWLCGDTVSKGMKTEMEFAQSRGIPIRRFADDFTERSADGGNAAGTPGDMPQQSDNAPMSRTNPVKAAVRNSISGPAEGREKEAKPSRRERFRLFWKNSDFFGKLMIAMWMIIAVCVVFSFVYSLVTWNWMMFLTVAILTVIGVVASFAFSSPLTAADLLFMIWWDSDKSKGK